MVPWGYIQKLMEEQRWYFGLLSVVALVCWVVDSVTGLAVGTMVALLVTGKETARGHAELSVTASGNQRLQDGTPKMISIDALAVDDVDLAYKAEEDSDYETESGSEESEPSIVRSKSYMESKRETAAFKQQAGMGNKHSHMAYAPEFDQLASQKGSGWNRQTSMTTELFVEEANEEPTVRGNRVFLYKLLGQLDFLAGDRHVDRVTAILASGPKAVVVAMQNVPWVDPDGMEALRDIITMLDENMVQVYLACPRPKVVEMLEKESWFQEKMADCQRVFPTEKSALMAAVGTTKDLEVGGGVPEMAVGA
jgi:MFS superfamily sulfate permease-like transporter